ncbi:hypothetical protein [Haloimpatiens massiliensis]|nr:hypothetical protein [Haloimpatiens massiliensis]
MSSANATTLTQYTLTSSTEMLENMQIKDLTTQQETTGGQSMPILLEG